MAWVYLAVFVAAVVCSTVQTLVVRNLALARGWAKSAASGRHIHTSPIPRLGGVAIFSSLLFVSGALACLALEHPGSSHFHLPPAVLTGVLIPAALMFGLGLYDDFRPLSAGTKFSVQLVIAVIVFLAGIRFNAVPLLFGYNEFAWFVSLPLTVLWILFITNAFNLLDGLDGLGAGSALFSTLTVFVVSLASTDYFVSFLTLALAGVILGFLRYNFNPASIFLGDCGSLTIGFLLSVLALIGRQKSTTLVAVAIPVVSFGLPILETTISILRRFIGGQPIFGADRNHIHHQLLKRGLTQRQAVILLYAVSASFGLLSIFLLYPGGGRLGLVLFIVGLGIWLGIQHLNYPEFFELKRMARNTLDQRQVIVNNLALRRASGGLARADSAEVIAEKLSEAFSDNVFDAVALTPATALARQFPGFKWHREQRPPDWYAWAMSLNLTSANDEYLATLTLCRSSFTPVHLDMNLLNSEFREALAIALERLREAEAPIYQVRAATASEPAV